MPLSADQNQTGTQDVAKMQHRSTVEQHVMLLTAFIHDLIRDYLPVGEVEHMIKDLDDHLWEIYRGDTLSRTVKTVDYENKHLGTLAMNLAKRILGEEYRDGYSGRL